ncbi:Hsp20/alpha crystallin family protein [Ensifer sp. IC3342]|nr:Hsp20/alpha crystallin family protein [Ensifer sp. BRP08]MCA1448499.1 Hsp20/alpha crystallin family protein [Ensifer sp. IC3342]
MTEATSKQPVKPETPAPAARPPVSLFESLRREIDQLFDDFHPLSWRSFPTRARDFDLPWSEKGAWQLAPVVDVVEADKEYKITAEMPGIDANDVEVKIANGVISIAGEKKEEKEEREKDRFLSERRYGSFQRTFQLPPGVDADKIEASFAKGVLTVRLPKTVEALSNEKKIAVKAE